MGRVNSACVAFSCWLPGLLFAPSAFAADGLQELATDTSVSVRLLGDDHKAKQVFLFEPAKPGEGTRQKAYELSCGDPEGLLLMLSKIGVPPALIPTFQVQAKNDAQADADLSGPVLTCEGQGTGLRWRRGTEGVEYYATFATAPNKLFRVGCQGLLEALGVHRHDAIEMTSIDEAPGKAEELRCRKGTAPAAVELKAEASSTSVVAWRGREIKPVGLSVNGADDVPVAWTIVQNSCDDWLKLDEETRLVGTAPASFAAPACSILLQAKAGQFSAFLDVPLVIKDDEPPVWASPTEDTTMTLSRGLRLSPIVFTATENDPEGPIDIDVKRGGEPGCDKWLTATPAGKGKYVVSGIPPLSGGSETCTLSLTAKSHGKESAVRQLTVNLAPVRIDWPLLGGTHSDANGDEVEDPIWLTWRYPLTNKTLALSEELHEITPIDLVAPVRPSEDAFPQIDVDPDAEYWLKFHVSLNSCESWLSLHVDDDTESMFVRERRTPRVESRIQLRGSVSNLGSKAPLCDVEITATNITDFPNGETLSTKSYKFRTDALAVPFDSKAGEEIDRRISQVFSDISCVDAIKQIIDFPTMIPAAATVIATMCIPSDDANCRIDQLSDRIGQVNKEINHLNEFLLKVEDNLNKAIKCFKVTP